MAVCYFNEDYNNEFNCDFEKKDHGIEVTVSYDISYELPVDANGVKSFSSNSEFAERDILIIDYKSKKIIYLKMLIIMVILTYMVHQMVDIKRSFIQLGILLVMIMRD